MTASMPYSEVFNYRTMFDFTDLRGCLPEKKFCPTSLTGLVNEHPDFRKFSYILNLSGLAPTYNNAQANFTIFVPSDKALDGIHPSVLENLDALEARHIVQSSTLKRRIPGAILEDSPAAIFTTLGDPNNLWVTNMSGHTYINNTINVIHKDMSASNGLIHVVDRLIWPNMSTEVP
jgi:uncharacterized surface protein with fasciclin (FAS1) repeats